MKILPILCVLLVTASCGTNADEPLSASARTEIEGDIESIIDQFIEHYNQKLLDESLKDISNSKEFRFGAGGEFLDYQRFYDHIREYLDGVERHEVRKIKSETTLLTKDMAVYSLVASLDMYLKSGKHATPVFAVTYIFQRVDNHWKIVYMHESD